MTLEDIGKFSDYVVQLCATDPQVTATHTGEFMKELHAVRLEDAKDALRQVLKGKVPFGPGRIIGAVLGHLEQQRRDANAGKAKVNEYAYSEGEDYRHERARLNEARPAWDLLDEEEKAHRLRMAGKELGCELTPFGRWEDGRGVKVPASWVQKRAMLVFAGQLQTEGV